MWTIDSGDWDGLVGRHCRRHEDSSDERGYKASGTGWANMFAAVYAT